MVDILSSYNHYKAKWDNTKQVRGRTEVIKPLGQRRRIWETIEKRGDDVYACKLYQTDCVKYYPDGSIGLCCGSWATPTTAEFMYTHSPFNCYKKYNKLWANVLQEGGGTKTYPIPEVGELRLYPVVVGAGLWYEPKETITIAKRVVDRTKAKDARDKLKPFLDWAKTFNRLSDGWIHNDTREQFGKATTEWWSPRWDYELPNNIVFGHYGSVIDNAKAYEYLQTCDDTGYMKMYLQLFGDVNTAHDKKVAKVASRVDSEGNKTQYDVKFYDMQFKWEYVKRKIYEIADNAVDIHKEVVIEVGNKAVTGVI